MPRNSKSQKTMILELLQNGIKVTPMLALNSCGCFRLAAVIHSIKADGHKVSMQRVKSHTGNKYAEYSMTG